LTPHLMVSKGNTFFFFWRYDGPRISSLWFVFCFWYHPFCMCLRNSEFVVVHSPRVQRRGKGRYAHICIYPAVIQSAHNFIVLKILRDTTNILTDHTHGKCSLFQRGMCIVWRGMLRNKNILYWTKKSGHEHLFCLIITLESEACCRKWKHICVEVCVRF